MILPFLSQNLHMTGKSLQFAAKTVVMNRQNNLIIFNLIFFPSSLKTTKENLCVFKIISGYISVFLSLRTFFFGIWQNDQEVHRTLVVAARREIVHL